MLILKCESLIEKDACALPTGSASLDYSISIAEEKHIIPTKAADSYLKNEVSFSTIKAVEVSNINQNTLLV